VNLALSGVELDRESSRCDGERGTGIRRCKRRRWNRRRPRKSQRKNAEHETSMAGGRGPFRLTPLLLRRLHTDRLAGGCAFAQCAHVILQPGERHRSEPERTAEHSALIHANVLTASGNGAILFMSHCRRDLPRSAPCSAWSKMLRDTPGGREVIEAALLCSRIEPPRTATLEQSAHDGPACRHTTLETPFAIDRFGQRHPAFRRSLPPVSPRKHFISTTWY
jgi:hypothetical protein